MATYEFSASALISTSPEKLYGIIADYHGGHPQILPKPPFVGLQVEQGGVGAGTVMRIEMKVLGQSQTFRSVVTEPEPGRVLVETNDTGLVTSFIVEPRAGGENAEVTFHTDLGNGRGGLLGALERWLIVKLMKPAYVRELENLARVANARVITHIG